MKNFVAAVAVAAFVGAFLFSPSMQPAETGEEVRLFTEAQAGDVYKLALSSNDGGSTNTGALTSNLKHEILCAQEACYKTGTSSSLSANCAQDYVLPQNQGCNRWGSINGLLAVDGGQVSYTANSSGVTQCFYQREFENGGHRYIVARALDGGNPACRVYQRLQNP